MVALCTALAERTSESTADLVRTFGTRLSASFADTHPNFFARAGTFFDFLESVEGHIHVEVRKLYPDAELPTFQVESRTASRMTMVYRSPRRMEALAEGMIIGSAGRFGVEARVAAEPVGDGTRFVIEIE